MKTNQHIFIYALAGALALAGCSDDLFEGGSVNGGTPVLSCRARLTSSPLPASMTTAFATAT